MSTVDTLCRDPAIDGGELNETWWTIFAAAVLVGTVMTLFGIMLAVNGHR